MAIRSSGQTMQRWQGVYSAFKCARVHCGVKEGHEKCSGSKLIWPLNPFPRISCKPRVPKWTLDKRLAWHPFSLLVFKVYGWPRRCLSGDLSHCHYPSCVREPERAFGMWGFCCHLPFPRPQPLKAHAVTGNGTVVVVGYHGASPLLPSGCLEVVFWEGNPPPVLCSSNAMSYCRSRTRLLVSSFWNSFKRPLEMLVGILRAWVFSALNFFLN